MNLETNHNPLKDLHRLLDTTSSQGTCDPNHILSIVEFIQQHQFLYAYLRDLVLLMTEEGATQKSLSLALETMAARMSYFHNWHSTSNLTTGLIQNGTLSADSIKPHIRLSDADYEAFYKTQNKKVAQRVNKNRKPFNRLKTHEPLVLNKHFDHCIRKTHAVNTIETLMAVLEQSNIEINRKWLDIGCGNGLIPNAVNSQRHSSNMWQIYGCDLQESKIKIAQNRACRKRTFFQKDVLSTLQEEAELDSAYDIISMFEFCEHFTDPYRLLKDISSQQFKVMVIATPLNQKLNLVGDNQPDPVHLWSFSVEAIKTMLTTLGLNIIMDVEITVGGYNKGLNWLTVVACKPEYHHKFKIM